MLSDIDRNLVIALQQNGRATHIALAKQLGIHVSTVSKKIRSLEQRGIMQIRALPNPYMLGYFCHAVIGIEADYKEINNICSRLYTIFNVNLIVTTFGRFDIIAIVFYPDWDQLLDFIKVTLSKTEGVKNLETFFVKDTVKRHFGFLNNGVSTVEIDEMDRRLIEKLAENGRYMANYLAKEMGISLATCTRRLSFLLNEKVIAIKALPNPAKLGNNSNALLFIKAQTKKLDSICAKIKVRGEIPLVLKLINGADIFVVYNAPDTESLYHFTKKVIMSLDGVISVNAFIRAAIKKRYYGGFVDEDPLRDKHDNL